MTFALGLHALKCSECPLNRCHNKITNKVKERGILTKTTVNRKESAIIESFSL
eukprot:m.103452 g.103452  ORF g.103452 m.103452 type:complete len:53 (+) comp27499_c0_seq1:57-215(+)